MKSFIQFIVEGVVDVTKEAIRAGRYFPTALEPWQSKSGVEYNPVNLRGHQFDVQVVDLNPVSSDNPNSINTGRRVGTFRPEPEFKSGLIRIDPTASNPDATKAHELGHATAQGALYAANPDASPEELDRLTRGSAELKTPYRFRKEEGLARAVESGEIASKTRSAIADQIFKQFSSDPSFMGGYTPEKGMELLQKAYKGAQFGARAAETSEQLTGLQDYMKNFSMLPSEQRAKMRQILGQGRANQIYSKVASGVEAGWGYSGVSDEDLAKQIGRRLSKTTGSGSPPASTPETPVSPVSTPAVKSAPETPQVSAPKPVQRPVPPTARASGINLNPEIPDRIAAPAAVGLGTAAGIVLQQYADDILDPLMPPTDYVTPEGKPLSGEEAKRAKQKTNTPPQPVQESYKTLPQALAEHWTRMAYFKH